MSRFRVTLMAASLFLSAVLAGCGGGGSGGSSAPTYSGSTSPAIVTTSNARALSADAYSAGQLSSSVVSVAKPAGDGNRPSSLLQNLAGTLENSVATILDTPKSPAKVVGATAQNTVQGFSGSFSYSIDLDQATGAFNGTLSFSQYRESASSVSISGPIAFSGVYSQLSGSFTSLNISMSNLNGSDGSKSYSLAGGLTYNAGVGTRSVTMSVVLSDNIAGRTYWVKDFRLTQAGSSLTITGTYYDPLHGYVVISTASPLMVTNIDAMPTDGQLLFSGGNGTKARLTFAGSGYTVEADTAGNGTFVVVP